MTLAGDGMLNANKQTNNAISICVHVQGAADNLLGALLHKATALRGISLTLLQTSMK